ncbi:MAG: hypothetical protein QG597_772 [Actinomycetota bacterium]|nr:hypothetical protein [Actinomycetota bacterium]
MIDRPGACSRAIGRRSRRTRDLERLIGFGDSGLLVVSCQGDFDLASSDDRFSLHGLRTVRGNLWQARQVADVLRKPWVAGLLTFHGTVAGQYTDYEPMAPDEEHETLRAKFETVGGTAARQTALEEITSKWNGGDVDTRRALIRRMAPRGLVLLVPPDGRAPHTIPAKDRIAII